MNIATHIESEKGKSITKTANEFIFQKFTVHKQEIAQIELYYFDDIQDEDCDENEWVLKFRLSDEDDWNIIAQGNIAPLKTKKRKASCMNCGSLQLVKDIDYLGNSEWRCPNCKEIKEQKGKSQKGECKTCGEINGKHSDDACEPYKGN